MKKLKLLPSILMLVLCVGVLAVGVFAITPTTNTISGQITINPSNAPVKIELLKDGTLIRTYDQVRTGITWDVNEFAKDGNTNLLFDTEGKNQVKEVPKIKFTLRVTNLSETEALGMFFENDELEQNADGTYKLATADNVLGDHVLKDKTDGTSPVANVYISKYTPLGPVTTVDGEKVYDTMDMNIVLSMADFYTSSKTADINYKLIIEKYEATENYLTSTDPLIKIPFKSSTLTGKAFDADAPTSIYTDDGFSNKGTIVYLAIPNTLKEILCNYNGSVGFTLLEGISFPSTLSRVGMASFAFPKLTSVDFSSCKNAYNFGGDGVPAINTTMLEFVDLSSSIVECDCGWISSNLTIDINVPNLQTQLNMCGYGYGWNAHNLYINGVLLTEIDYSIMAQDYAAFVNNKGITKVNFTGNETQIVNDAFNGLDSLQSITLPNTIETISDGAFDKMVGLRSIVIPSSVKQIRSNVFSHSGNLKEITLDGCTDITIETDFYETKIEKIIVKKGTRLAEAYTLPTNAKYGYTATWNVSEIPATIHTEDTVYTCTYVANS